MIITFGNFKGGIGKTTTTLLFGYILEKMYSKKVLLIDTDPQMNLTELAEMSYKQELNREKNIFSASFDQLPTAEHIQPLGDSIDILAGSWGMGEFEKYAHEYYEEKYLNLIFSSVLSEVKAEYDFILIDTAPTTNLVNDNAIIASNYVVLPTQTVPLAFDSTKKYYMYLREITNVSDDFEILGVVPYLVGRSATDTEFLAKYKDFFLEDLFTNVIQHSDRVKTWSHKGITDDKPYDKRTLGMFADVVEEALNRIKEFELHV